MYQLQPIETLSLIIFRVPYGNILVEVYGVFVTVILKLHSNSYGRNINLSDDVWVMILIDFESPPQPLLFYLQVDNMVNVVIHSHKLLAILPLGYFFLIL